MENPKKEPKQETLEEFSEIISIGFTDVKGDCKSIVKNAILTGAKWQEQRMYSEEDMLRFAQKYAVNKLDKTHLEQFKKK